MRLTSIKLSGFKSFADLTQFSLPGQLIGVVGPNGCGKSNIMDAVRWVLGESRASELRGESMQDVIFNGSSTRKPAHRASVELIFDNSLQRATGPWGQYAEIAVKRLVTRDGSSSYFLNNQSVRRRDVHDLFLGTGLGPRAYAIIGQGTISRLIESRPEDLRLFLEEAAGVSKYKERRRESENRLRDSRENLTRVQDLLGELTGQLEKLERQAAVAQRYQNLQQQHSETQQQWWWLKQTQAQTQLERIQTQGLEAINALEASLASLRASETQLEALRQAHYTAGDAVNAAQGKMYEANANLAKLETEIQFVAQNRERIQNRLQHIEQLQTQHQENEQKSVIEDRALQEQKTTLEERIQYQEGQCEQAQELVPEYEAHKQQTQQITQEARERVHLVQQQIQVLSTEQGHASDQIQRLTEQLEDLRQEQNHLPTVDAQAIEEKQQRLATYTETLNEGHALLEELAASLLESETDRNAQSANLKDAEIQLTQLRARAAALTALQEKVQTEGKRQPWLEKHGLTHLHALWTQLQVERGWENALEAALRERLQALEVGRLGNVAALQQDAPAVKLVFFSKEHTQAAHPHGPRPESNTVALAASKALQTLGIKPLADCVQSEDTSLLAVVKGWLAFCWRADDLVQALAARHALPEGHSIFVAQGHALSRDGLDFYAADDAQAGMLERAQELQLLEKSIQVQAPLVEEQKQQLQALDAHYADIRAQSTAQQNHLQNQERERHALEVATMRLQQELENHRARQSQLTQSKEALQTSLQEWNARMEQVQAQFDLLDETLAQAQEEHSAHENQMLAANQTLDDAKDTLRTLERSMQETQFEQRTLEAKVAELHRFIETIQQQQAALVVETQNLQKELQQSHETNTDTGLQQALEDKSQSEERLRTERLAHEALSESLRQAQEQHMAKEQALEPLRTKITEHQLQEQATRLAFEQNQQALLEAKADIETIATLAQKNAMTIEQLPTQLERLQKAIQHLGAVNLAALDELTAARERQSFLQEQTDDLVQAMQTLEDTIRKIDAQTRALLASTFESVNRHFGELFPALFGGGQAELVMTGDEILNTGVQVMARPPGKKNQTIHLLSGGEKALTAIALVFAIFQLNPAPFCLLDEVDAPLDDANTERYAKLVQRMSKATQFLFISHNKISMEAAQQLIGVTMQEQGVSRIVTVDMQAVASLVENG